ncbi:MAG: sigma-70 family RNA polymerase sigma factor [Lentisphaeria bacterium]|nr:sigma-70 family RNA polymerase sigma factor [Lentisphaeria bacterium]
MSHKDPEKWVDLYGDYLYRFALSRLSDPSAAEDVVQETLLAAIKGVERYDETKVDFKFWLRGICRNKIVDTIRKRMREIPVEEIFEYDESPNRSMQLMGIPNNKPDTFSFAPDKQYQKKEFWKVFQSCASKLKSPMREIYLLKEIESLSTEEICKEFNITPNNLWVIVHRARGQMKKCLNKNWGDRVC